MPRWQRKQLEAKCRTVKKGSSSRCGSAAPTPKGGTRADRFIATRSSIDFDAAHQHVVSNGDDALSARSPSQVSFGESLSRQLRVGGDADSRVLAFRQKAPQAKEAYHEEVRKILYSRTHKRAVKPKRVLPTAPERILDAPELVNDYYLNLLDWSSKDVLAVALDSAVYMWNAADGSIEELCDLRGEDDEMNDEGSDFVTAVKWTEGGKTLAVGTTENVVGLWDAERRACVRTLEGHTERVSSLAWKGSLLCTGSRDSHILMHDVRKRNSEVLRMRGHEQEVCGLSFSMHDEHSLASGGNDNRLCLWDVRKSALGAGGRNWAQPRHTLTDHCAAVKALAWCPHQRNVLASGGGTADRCIKFWNTANGACLNSIDTGSQVCSLLWNPHAKEILSSHGFANGNDSHQLSLWSYPSMAKIHDLKGHTERVLHMAASPSGETVCSAGADETLRFWRIFENRGRGKRSQNRASGNGNRLSQKSSRSIR
jgi:cell division cycle protein 20 (cofactor of APC complex)